MSGVNPSRARGLGAELRAARKRKNLTLQAVGAAIGRHHSWVSRCERGMTLPSVEATASMLTVYAIKGGEWERLIQMAREAADPNWVMPGMDEQLAALIEDEKVARRIVNVQPLIIPGLCQTEDYAAAIMVGAGATRAQVNQRVLMRLARQALLAGRNGPEYVAIIGEYALRYPPCDAGVMVGQLRKLLDLGKRRNTSILVLPLTAGYTPAIEGPFVLMEFDRSDPVVQQEHYRTTTTLTSVADVRDYKAAVDEILRKTMSEAESAAFIESLVQEKEKTR